MPGQYSLLKESWNMVLMYALALIMIFVLTFHLLLVSPLTGRTFDETLTYSFVLHNLTYYRIVFGILLYAAVIHGMNGLMIVLLEWLLVRKYQWAVNLLIVILIAVLLALGTYTLVVL
jgi:succinate dehydrogenase hydrophobic anchor subunit